MLTYYFRIAARNLWKNKSFSAITIFGMAIGLATCMLITLFISDELSYDKFNDKHERIYRINADFAVNGNSFHERYTPALLGEVLKKDYPQIENFCRLTLEGNTLVKHGAETIMEKNAFFADSTIFKVFSLPMLAGDPATALRDPFSVVISEQMANKYFNGTTALGKVLRLDNTRDYVVTGVIKDVPAQSHLHFNFLKAISEIPESRQDNWMADNFVTYVLLRPGTSVAQLNGFLKEATRRYMEGSLEKMVGDNITRLEQKGGRFGYYAIRLDRIHLHSALASETEPLGNMQYVYIFMAAGIIILLIACVNFVNLSTARSASRAKEVGLRKVMGSHRSILIVQFLAESVLTGLLAMILAIILAFIFLPFLNSLAGKTMRISPVYVLYLLPVVLLVGLLAGVYPAFYLSKFEPVKVLKGRVSGGFKNSWLRNGLVTFQFATAILLLVGTFVVYRQLGYIQSKQLGYNRQQVLVVTNVASLWVHAKGFKQEIEQLPGVKGSTMNASLPIRTENSTNIYSKDAARSPGQVSGIDEWYIDADYIPVFGMEMASGRNFSPQMPTDSQALIINESAAKLLGFKDITDKYLYTDGRAFKVIGVVKDFNGGSLHHKINPIVLRLGEYRDNLAIRFDPKHTQAVIEGVRKAYHAREGMTGQPFTYFFLDEAFNNLYQSEVRTAHIFIAFAVLAVLIACMGVFGLITYAAEQRTREIGIRKVLGASVTGIVTLLSANFLKLVTIGFVIATPLAWYLMDKWLNNFAYRTQIGWSVFAWSVLLMAFITMGTVGFRAVRAALANPVKSLNAE
ncbi:ABC transporter permease [uncultured Chitinophaga sp.]|uniref:ABC transporter permease n=1 Tax=uncultured Chitinophaga sp. TaxID=339340 RepID=UPI0025E78E83|nr:ABC transporter permease [uncultured Chitinophaga sp.]